MERRSAESNVDVYASPDKRVALTDGDALNGGDVLPGFSFSVTEWFNWAMKVNRET